MPIRPIEMSDSAIALCLSFIFLVPLAGAGLALINTGLGRSRNAAHAMMAALTVFGAAALVFFAFGFAWEGFSGGRDHVLIVGGKPWSWLAAEPFFFRGLKLDGSPASLAALLQLVAVGLAALIPLAGGAERWRLGACCASTAILAGLVYPLFGHWAWGGGWLAQLGINYGLGRGFIDAGGGSTVQALGGLTALAMAWILGPRRGKFTSEGMPTAIPGHNGVLVLLGCFMTLVGWLGLNSAGAILFTAAPFGTVVRVGVNTILAAASAVLVATAITRARFGKPDASLSANGWVGGLAASSASCAIAPPAAAMLIGAVAGALVIYSIELFELRLTVDDPGGAVSVHGIDGIWGVLAVGFFGSSQSGASGQGLAQLVGVATLIGFVLPLSYGLNLLLNRFYPQRVAPEGERQGMDLHELGAGAYPEFSLHTEDFMQR